MGERFSGFNCPRCYSGRTIDIIYGKPNKPIEDAAMRGEIELGGYSVTDDDPTHFCTRCGKRF